MERTRGASKLRVTMARRSSTSASIELLLPPPSPSNDVPALWDNAPSAAAAAKSEIENVASLAFEETAWATSYPSTPGNGMAA
jgi:hypothetical protein